MTGPLPRLAAERRGQRAGDFRLFAHRGASAHAPENTLRAFRLAAALGARWVELDVQRVENELVVFHDPHLGRTTDGHGPLAGRTLAELRTLDAGGGERIPLLREVVAALPPAVGINVELKGADTARPVAALIGASVRSGRRSYGSFLVSSFDHRQLARLHRLDPQIPVGALVSRLPVDWLGLVRRLGASSLHIPLPLANPVLVRQAHGHGLRVYVFTVNRRATITRLARMGVDGVFTNHPELERRRARRPA